MKVLKESPIPSRSDSADAEFTRPTYSPFHWDFMLNYCWVEVAVYELILTLKSSSKPSRDRF